MFVATGHEGVGYDRGQEEEGMRLELMHSERVPPSRSKKNNAVFVAASTLSSTAGIMQRIQMPSQEKVEKATGQQQLEMRRVR